MAIINKKLAIPWLPNKCRITPAMVKLINHLFVQIAFLGFSYSFPSGFMKLTAKTGLKINATTNEAANVRMSTAGR